MSGQIASKHDKMPFRHPPALIEHNILNFIGFIAIYIINPKRIPLG
ncbi:hypothetical protein ACRXLK_003165 [Cronobacter turicensis]